MIKYFYVQLEFIQYESYMISSRTDFYGRGIYTPCIHKIKYL